MIQELEVPLPAARGLQSAAMSETVRLTFAIALRAAGNPLSLASSLNALMREL